MLLVALLILLLLESEGRARLLIVQVLLLALLELDGLQMGCVVENPGGAGVVDWKVVVLVVVAPGAAGRAELAVVAGAVLMAGSVLLRDEDGEIPDCCMICAIVVGAVEVSDRLARCVGALGK
jgi:hypothetical protein